MNPAILNNQTISRDPGRADVAGVQHPRRAKRSRINPINKRPSVLNRIAPNHNSNKLGLSNSGPGPRVQTILNRIAASSSNDAATQTSSRQLNAITSRMTSAGICATINVGISATISKVTSEATCATISVGISETRLVATNARPSRQLRLPKPIPDSVLSNLPGMLLPASEPDVLEEAVGAAADVAKVRDSNRIRIRLSRNRRTVSKHDQPIPKVAAVGNNVNADRRAPAKAGMLDHQMVMNDLARSVRNSHLRLLPSLILGRTRARRCAGPGVKTRRPIVRRWCVRFTSADVARQERRRERRIVSLLAWCQSIPPLGHHLVRLGTIAFA